VRVFEVIQASAPPTSASCRPPAVMLDLSRKQAYPQVRPSTDRPPDRALGEPSHQERTEPESAMVPAL
jgi:hypothetical protein